MALQFPNIDPVAVHLGPLQIHWYALAYLAGFLGGWWLAKYLCRLDKNRYRPNETDIDDFMTWAILAVLLGGRIGYVLFYDFHRYLSEPLEALKIWHGGMSWHGGLIGVVTATVIYAYRKNVSLLRLTDLFSASATIGFFFGRIANFINGELYGRVTDVPWAFIFPRGGDEPRHPSQLYQAGLEGLALFLILVSMMHIAKIRNTRGLVSAAFLFFYAAFRFIIEFFREPDAQLGYLALHLSMGQWLCVPVMLGGILLAFISLRIAKREHAQSI